MAEIWPPGWLVPGMKEAVIELLRRLEISQGERKGAYYEWCKHSGVEMTAEDVERVTGVVPGASV